MDLTKSNYFERLVQKNDNELLYMVNHPEGIKKEAFKVAQYILDERKQVGNYSTFTYSELLDAQSSINKEVFPARIHLIEEEIKNRNFDRELIPFDLSDDITPRSLKEKLTFTPLPSFRIRPDTSFKQQGDTIDQFVSISEEDFRLNLLNPEGQRDLIVEDFNIRLYIRFDTQKHEYGFKFWYFDKNLKKEYKSVLHGISDSFAIQFIADVINKGKSELQILKWKEVRSSVFADIIHTFQTILTYSASAVILYLFIDQQFFSATFSNIVFDFLFSNARFIFVIGAFSMLLGIIQSRHQLMNLKKLSIYEQIDTLSPILIFPLFLLIAYLMWISDLSLLIQIHMFHFI